MLLSLVGTAAGAGCPTDAPSVWHGRALVTSTVNPTDQGCWGGQLTPTTKVRGASPIRPLPLADARCPAGQRRGPGREGGGGLQPGRQEGRRRRGEGEDALRETCGCRADFVQVPVVPSERQHAPHTPAHVCVPTPYKNIFSQVPFRHAKQCTATTGPTDVGGYIRGRVVD